MADIVDDLLSGKISREDPQGDVVDQLLRGPSIRKAPPGPGPETQYRFGKDEPGATVGAHVKAGMVDDLQTKINIYAKDRGIDPSRYGVYDGEIMFLGDDGYFHRETPDTLGQKAKRAGAQMVSNAPSIVMGSLMAPAGPGAAALGAAGGEGIRKAVGSLAFGEPQTSKGNIWDMTKEGALGFAGEKVAGKVIGTLDVARGREGAKLVKAAGRGRQRISLPEVKEMGALGRRYGIDLVPPQTTRSPELISRFNLLGDLPETADMIAGVRRKQFDQIQNAIGDYIESVAPGKITPMGAGKEAVKAAKEQLQRVKGIRSKTVRPYYDEAKDMAGIDISDTVAKVDEMLDNTKPGMTDHAALTRVRKLLTKEAVDPQGKTIRIPEDRLRMLDKAKKDINAKWKKDPKTAPDIETQYEMNGILESMLKEVDAVSEAYQKARAMYRKMSPMVDKFKKGKVGELAKLEGDKAKNAASMIFGPKQSSPEIVRATRRAIVKHAGQEKWDALIKVHLQDAFESIKESVTGGVTNVGGHFRQKVFGNIKQRKMLEAAMTREQFRNLEDFSKVLDRAGLILGKESTTATRLVQLGRESAGPLTRAVRAAAYPLRTWKMEVYTRLMSALDASRNERLARVMLSEKAARELQYMLRLKPESQRLIQRLSTFLTMATGQEIGRAVDRYQRQDVTPPTLNRPGGSRLGTLAPGP